VTGLHDDLDLNDPELAHAAEVLSRSLIRFHPSFRFEERLAARLRLAGFGPMARVPAQVPLAVGLATSGPSLHATGRVPRPVIVGGAIASGVSIAGAAVVAWRRLRRDA
jgi:hypothetical protein